MSAVLRQPHRGNRLVRFVEKLSDAMNLRGFQHFDCLRGGKSTINGRPSARYLAGIREEDARGATVRRILLRTVVEMDVLLDATIRIEEDASRMSRGRILSLVGDIVAGRFDRAAWIICDCRRRAIRQVEQLAVAAKRKIKFDSER